MSPMPSTFFPETEVPVSPFSEKTKRKLETDLPKKIASGYFGIGAKRGTTTT
jgi:hypothetical protein